jgi:putative exporter of polyketide antibiotics
MLARLKAACLHSMTIAWSYCIALAGALASIVDDLADALGDPSVKDQIGSAIGDAKTTGRIMLVISVVTIIARLRTLRRKDQCG